MPSTECLTVVPLTGDETAHHRDDWCRESRRHHRSERGGGKAGEQAIPLRTGRPSRRDGAVPGRGGRRRRRHGLAGAGAARPAGRAALREAGTGQARQGQLPVRRAGVGRQAAGRTRRPDLRDGAAAAPPRQARHRRGPARGSGRSATSRRCRGGRPGAAGADAPLADWLASLHGSTD
jgi:hypothetical protein